MEAGRRAWDSRIWTPAGGDWYFPNPSNPGQRVASQEVMRQPPGYSPFCSMAFPDAGYGYPHGSEYPRRRRYRERGGYPTRGAWRARRPRDALPYWTIPLAVRGIPETEDVDWFYGRDGQLHYF